MVTTGQTWPIAKIEGQMIPADITYEVDPGRPEYIIRNDYVPNPNNRDTVQYYTSGELCHWINEWGGLRIRVAATSAWDSALRLIAADDQSGNIVEVQNAPRTKNLFAITSSGQVVAPNVLDPLVVLYGSAPRPQGLPAPAVVARIGSSPAIYHTFAGVTEGAPATPSDGWDAVIGTAPIYSASYGYLGGMGMRSNIALDSRSYVLERFGGIRNSGYVRMRLRLPALGSRNPRVFQTEAAGGGLRHGVRVNSAGRIEIVGTDASTVLATSAINFGPGSWFDLGIYYVGGSTGTCQVRIYTNPLSETVDETITFTGSNFHVGTGDDIIAYRWGQHATSAGSNTLDIAMLAHNPGDWLASAPPTGLDAVMFIWDGANEVPVTSAVTLQSRAVAKQSTVSLANGGTENSSITLAPGYRALKVKTSVPARVRLYRSTADRTADASRPSGTAPTGDHGVFLDITTTSGDLDWGVFPVVDGFTDDASQSVPYAITNLSGSTASVALDLTWVRTEV